MKLKINKRFQENIIERWISILPKALNLTAAFNTQQFYAAYKSNVAMGPTSLDQGLQYIGASNNLLQYFYDCNKLLQYIAIFCSTETILSYFNPSKILQYFNFFKSNLILF